MDQMDLQCIRVPTTCIFQVNKITFSYVSDLSLTSNTNQLALISVSDKSSTF